MVITADILRLAEARYPAFVFTGEIWVLMAEERQVNTVDEYWDDLSADESNRLPIVFIDRDAWYWNSIKGEHRSIIVNNSLTLDGRNLLDRLLHVSPPMVDYSL